MDNPLRVVVVVIGVDNDDWLAAVVSWFVLVIPTCFEMCNPADLKDVSVTFAFTGARLPTFALIFLKSDDAVVTIVASFWSQLDTSNMSQRKRRKNIPKSVG